MSALHRGRFAALAFAVAATACAAVGEDEAALAVSYGVAEGAAEGSGGAGVGGGSGAAGVDEGAGGANAGAERADRDPQALTAEQALLVAAGQVEGEVEVALLPEIPPPSRPRKRLNIDQLDAALRRASGGIGWTSGPGSEGTNELESLALTLGKPNYTDLTTEDLDPTALFHKFVRDAASSVCTKLVAKEAAAPVSEHVFVVGVGLDASWESAPALVDANLARQLLRLHGRVVATDSAELERWRFLFRAASKVGKSPAEGWRAVCVALIDHPAFTTY